jgi:WD40 repeat protein
MKRKRRRYILLATAVAACITVWAVSGRHMPSVDGAALVSRLPRIHPDYSEIVIPPNIAPMNFVIREPGSRFLVRIGSNKGDPIEIDASSSRIVIPASSWRSLLQANQGNKLYVDIHVKAAGQWRQYETIVNRVAEADIAPYLAYRRIGPVHNKWTKVGVYQRDMSTYRESVVLDGMSLETGCVNCHSFANNNPNQMLIGIRSARFGNAAILAADGRLEKIGAKFGYTAWHPSGRLAAYSINDVWQFFHAAGTEVRDVIDIDAALAYCRFDDGKMELVPRAADKTRLESYPAWSPDGHYLYYCSAPILWSDSDEMPPEQYAEVQYDLMKIRYDIATDSWGEPEMVLSSQETGLSILQPRLSPDGRFMLFCMCRYGGFPVYQPTSDLYLMELSTGEYSRLAINSDFAESWHSWSSNSRWIAFSSRRGNGGFFTRCYLSFVDTNGLVHKPFILPQHDPEFYDSFLETISVPELIDGPIPVASKLLTRIAQSDPARVDAVTGASKPVGSPGHWQPARE